MRCDNTYIYFPKKYEKKNYRNTVHIWNQQGQIWVLGSKRQAITLCLPVGGVFLTVIGLVAGTGLGEELIPAKIGLTIFLSAPSRIGKKQN